MKRQFLLFLTFAVSIISAQTLPAPAYEATFNGTGWNTAAGFSIGTSNISSSTDPFKSGSKAIQLNYSHGEVKLDAQNTTLRQQGTISFFMKYDVPYTPSALLQSLGVAYPVLYLSNGLSSYSEGLMLGFSHINNTKQLVIKSYSAANTGISQNVNNAVSVDKWHHYTISYKFGTGGHISVYQDGVQLFTQNISHSFTNTSMPFEFFGHTSSGSYMRSAIGGLDEIRAYTTPFTATEVKDLYTSYLTMTRGSKTGKFNFNSSNFNDYFGNYVITEPSLQAFQYQNSGALNLGGNNSMAAFFYKGTQVSSTSAPATLNSNLGNKFSVSFASRRDLTTEYNTNQSIHPIITIPLNSSTGNTEFIIGRDKSTSRIYLKLFNYVYSHNIGQAGNWDHVTFTVDLQSNMRLYINGEEAFSINLNTAYNLSVSQTRSILIGKDFDTNSEYMGGVIDDLIFDNKIYDIVEANKTYLQWKSNVTSYETNSTLAVHQTEKIQNDIKIHPNPTTDFVKLSEKADVQVYDASGKLIHSYKKIESVDLSTQKQGVYILKLSNSKGTQSVKVIKK